DSLLTALARRGEAVACLHCSLRLEDGSRRHEILTPARPTRDGPQLLELLRLRLEAVELPCRVEELRLEVEPGRLDDGGTVQAELFPVAGPGGGARDAEAGARALARLRAELGDAAVVRARLADRWLPEGSFLWEPLGPRAALLPAPPSATEDPPLVRRIYSVARALPPRPRHLRDDGWLIRGAEHGAVMRLI